jgi:GAF domain-containing protein
VDESEGSNTRARLHGQEVETLRSLLLAAERRGAAFAELTPLMNEGRDPLELAQRGVELTARATRAAGSFIYLWSREDDRLVLRVATEGWQRSLLGRIRLRLGEGITGWSALMRQTVLVNNDPLSDPRSVEFEDLREDVFKSMIAVPILEPGGEVLGVFTLYSHSENAFSQTDVNLASEVGALLASGLVQAETVSRLRTQSAVARFLADLPLEAYLSIERCLDIITMRVADHLDAEACVIEMTSEKWGEAGAGQAAVVLKPAFAERHQVFRPASIDRALLHEMARNDDLHRLRIPLGSTHPVGAITCYRARRFPQEDIDLAEAISAQAAAAVMSLLGRDVVAPVIEQLLEPADSESVERLLRTLGLAHGPARIFAVRTHLSGTANISEAGMARAALGSLAEEYPGSLTVSGRGPDHLLFISCSSVSRPPDPELTTRMVGLSARPGLFVTAGVGPTARTASMLLPSLRHALTASRWAELVGQAGTLVAYESIAHLRLLPNIALAMSRELRNVLDALRGLVTYDLEHGADLARTLDAFVTNGGSVSRTAAALFVHRNTLRQRLRRIEELTGQAPEEFDNWLTAGLAARMIEQSEEELGTAPGPGNDMRCPRA